MALRIIVVDDEPQVAKVIQLGLETEGHEVLAFNAADEAARCAEEQRLDGAVIDAVMPGMDGFALVRRIRGSSLNARIPIIMLTGYDDAPTMRQSFESGATIFMGKPFNRERLSSVFRAACHVEAPNKRHHPRVPLEAEIQCKCGQTQFSANMVNVSEGGALLEPSNGLKPGRRVEARFELPPSLVPLTPVCKVVRTEPSNHMGVEFVDLRSSQRLAIREFVAKCS
jgi:DNA-binding response OmpR family regulator